MCGGAGERRGWEQPQCHCSAFPPPPQVTLLAVMVTQFNMRVQHRAQQMEDVAAVAAAAVEKSGNIESGE